MAIEFPNRLHAQLKVKVDPNTSLFTFVGDGIRDVQNTGAALFRWDIFLDVGIDPLRSMAVCTLANSSLGTLTPNVDEAFPAVLDRDGAGVTLPDDERRVLFIDLPGAAFRLCSFTWQLWAFSNIG